MVGILATAKLRTIIDKGDLVQLQIAMLTAEKETVDATVIQEAKVLLATQPLRAAMERRDVAGLRTAIAVAEGEAEVDEAMIKVSGGCYIQGSDAIYFTHHPPPTTHHPPPHHPPPTTPPPHHPPPITHHLAPTKPTTPFN